MFTSDKSQSRDNVLNGLDLFSGIGGNSLALREYVKTIAYCEADRHAQSILLSRMSDGSLEPAPIWDDIKTLSGQQFDVPIDIIIGGFPCQDISIAGKGKGIVEGNRSGLFYEIVRLAKEIKPTFLFLENVPAIRTRGLDTVIQELTEIGYDCRWTMLSASDVGAPHKRERWFLLAYSESYYNKRDLRKLPGTNEQITESKKQYQNSTRELRDAGKHSRILADSNVKRLFRQGNWWKTEPNVGRVVNGLPFRVDRIKRLGNAVVPLQAKEAFERFLGLK